MENGGAVPQPAALDDRANDGGPAVALRPNCLVAASGSGGSSSGAGSGPPALGATSATAARRRTPGRWRRIPRAAARTEPPAALPLVVVGCEEEAPGIDDQLLEQRLRELEEARKLAPTLTANGWKPAGPLLPEEVQTIRDQWRKDRLYWKNRGARAVVAPRGSRELAESTEEGNRRMLEEAKRLEEEDEDLCDTEEDKVAFRAFKVKFAAVYRRLATPPSLRTWSSNIKAPASDTIGC